jgi:hypothetical protein
MREFAASNYNLGDNNAASIKFGASSSIKNQLNKYASGIL